MLRFTKMHGAGNDYIYVNAATETLPNDLSQLAKAISHRRFGAGADGLIIIHPSDTADARMQMFNADGSEAEMCGNGIRCVAKYVYEAGWTKNTVLAIDTRAGVLKVSLEVDNGFVEQVTVDMGEPILEPARIPTRLSGPGEDGRVVHQLFEIEGRRLHVTCVSMGNPHCIVFVPEITDELVFGIGPKLEMHDAFPKRTNVEFVQVLAKGEARQRTWERGSGETWACGTGASAVCVAGVLTGNTDRELTIHLLGGDLRLRWDEASNHVFMTGSAAKICDGEWPC
jgi:diaminopimelate epimerase